MTTNKFTLDDMMRKITAMLATADDPATPPEAAANYRAKAESMMRKYRIEETELIQQGGLAHEVNKPGSKVINLTPSSSPFYNTYYNMMIYIAQHTGCRVHYKWDYIDGAHTLCAVLVGFEADIRFAEVLYQNARLVFADRMEPKVNPNLSDEDNVYRLRSAGIERPRIGEMMGWGAKSAQKVTTVYKRACKQRGEDPVVVGKGLSVKAFREAYESAFLGELWNRLYHARNAADDNSGALVLANRKDMVNEAFYSLYPDMRPSNTPATTKARKGRSRGWTAADERRYMRAMSAGGQAGSSAGKAAASEIDVSSRSPKRRLS